MRLDFTIIVLIYSFDLFVNVPFDFLNFFMVPFLSFYLYICYIYYYSSIYFMVIEFCIHKKMRRMTILVLNKIR